MYTGIVEVDLFTKKIRETIFYKKISAVDVKEELINMEKDIFCDAMLGQMAIYINRKSHVINITLGNAVNLMVYLNKAGRMYLANKDEDYSKDYLLKFEFLNGKTFLIYGDEETKVEVVAEEERKDYFTKLAADPLGKEFDINCLNSLVMEFEGTILEALVKGGKIGGIDELYANEILFVAGILPTRDAGSLNMKEANNLFLSIQDLIQEARSRNGKLEIKYTKNDIQTGEYQAKIYGREGQKCIKCDDIVKAETINGLKAFYCPTCQK